MLEKEDFLKICKLSRLEIKEEEYETFLFKLNGIFGWIDQLNSIDVSSVNISIDEITPTLEREDKACMTNTRDEILSNSFEKKFGMFSVPKVVE